MAGCSDSTNDLADIEDVVLLAADVPNRDDAKRRVSTNRHQRRRLERQQNSIDGTVKAAASVSPDKDMTGVEDDSFGCQSTDSFLPEKFSVYVRTWGCSHNTSDGEYMAGLLVQGGYRLTDNPDVADMWLLNSCTVKTPAEHHVMNAINEAKDKGKRVVVAGCVPQADPKADYLDGVSIVGTRQVERVVDVVEETLKGSTVRLRDLTTRYSVDRPSFQAGPDLMLPKIRRNPLIEIISINSGCLNRCTYCKTKFARGDLASYSPDEIIERAKQAFGEGVRELWLTSEDLGAYGRDIRTNLPNLLRELVKVIPNGCMMRMGMTNPPYILEHLEAIAEILNHPRVYEFIHIPIQSGSDYVLRDMKREYCVEDFVKVVEVLRSRVPGISIATDFICAFPSETEDDHNESMSLLEKHRFESVFINQYFARPGTPAAKWPQVDRSIAKQRTKGMTSLFHSYHSYDKLLGREFDILITETSFDKKFLVGHTKSYVQVLVEDSSGISPSPLLGRMVRVKIVDTMASKFSVRGQILEHRYANLLSWLSSHAGFICLSTLFCLLAIVMAVALLR